MAAAPNNLLTVEQRLWTIALAWPEFANNVKLGNRRRYDLPGVRWPEQAKPNRQPADYITVDLDYSGRGTLDRGAPRTMCIQPNVRNFDFTWTLIAGDKVLTGITQIYSELMAAMTAAGTQLGIPAIVARWEDSSQPGRSNVKERQIQVIQRITIKA